MADELDVLAECLNRLVEQERLCEAQAMLPEYARELDRRLRSNGGEEALKKAITTFQTALAKARASRAHMAGELSDMSRARAYTGETAEAPCGWQLIG